MHFRAETDSFGQINVAADKLWGASTQRSLENFLIGKTKEALFESDISCVDYFAPREIMRGEIIHAIALVKYAAAKTNCNLKLLDAKLAEAITDACTQIMSGNFDEHFPLVIWQTGSGTQTNMNVNEVVANLAIKNLGGVLGSKNPIHPNDHVNLGQSSNDTFPTAMNIAIFMAFKNHLILKLKAMHNVLLKKTEQFSKIIKIGRTHLQDATPMSLGQEFSGYAAQIEYAILRLQESSKNLLFLAQGGTAVGTGLNCHKEFPKLFAQNISEFLGATFKTANNKFEALACHDGVVEFSGTLNTLAVGLMKIANDVRLLGSGPRCGLGELILPENEPGSSIMPGKVNPTQCEAVAMVCAQVMGNHVTVSIAGSNGHMELNTFKPVIACAVLQSVKLLADVCDSFTKNCLENLTPNEVNISKHLENSLMLVTALNPHIGYDKAARIAKKAHQENLSLKESAQQLGILTNEEFEKLIKPEEMI